MPSTVGTGGVEADRHLVERRPATPKRQPLGLERRNAQEIVKSRCQCALIRLDFRLEADQQQAVGTEQSEIVLELRGVATTSEIRERGRHFITALPGIELRAECRFERA